MPIGSPPIDVRGYFDADMTTATELTLRLKNGTARVLGANETFALYTIQMSSMQEDAVITIFADANDDNVNDAGETLVTTQVSATNPHVSINASGAPYMGAPGAKPHIISDGTDGTVTGSFTGRIVRR